MTDTEGQAGTANSQGKNKVLWQQGLSVIKILLRYTWDYPIEVAILHLFIVLILLQAEGGVRQMPVYEPSLLCLRNSLPQTSSIYINNGQELVAAQAASALA